MLVELHKEDKIRGTFYLALFFSESNNLEGERTGIILVVFVKAKNESTIACLFNKKIGECLRRHSHDLQK